ncbi:MAG: tellurite resistance protein TerC [Candidatus Midichloriaceae bacterium]|jgi:tellurite resistance protein TerC
MFPTYFWILLILMLCFAVFIDLGISFRSNSTLSVKSAVLMSALWLFLAFIVGIAIFLYTDFETLIEFSTAYFIELSLSVDNVFVFIMIFSYFGIDSKHQHKILFYGVLGAIIFRLLMITLGLYIIDLFQWIFIPFGLFLIYSGYKLPTMGTDNMKDMDDNIVIRLVKKYFKYTNDMSSGSFYIKKDNKIYITPLMLALLLIEKADIIFAFDSVPAVLAITKEPFIAFSSNVLAILGLRSMYFILYNAIQKFQYLKHGIGYMLIYIGFKMILGFYGIHFSNYVSIITIFAFIIISILFSLFFEKKYKQK